jgi:hypothetical protein
MMGLRSLWCGVAAALVVIGMSGCENKAGTTAKAPAPAASFPPSLFLASAPADAKDIKDVKPTLKAGDKVAIMGRIGGGKEPFVNGRAMFTLVDKRVKACSDDPEDTCKTPWDYCCEAPEDLRANSATIQVLNSEGQPIKAGLDGVHGLKPLATITVVGTVANAEAGNLLVKAEGIYVAQ